ncbi:MAG TPA: hypothetical protein VG267_10310 [Terracidiphilus sp.]|jgi:hypothetical protein|nr:hypothetical protein [Terracidiphilus sp.]
MGALTGEKLLRGWEAVRELPEQEAVLRLLALAWPKRAENEWAQLPLGERNAMLLALRTATLGRRMEGFAECPACGALLEFVLDAGELEEQLRAQLAAAEESEQEMARPVNTADLIAASAAEDEEQARQILLARTMKLDRRAAAGDGTLERFERMNRAGEIRIELACPECPAKPVLDLDVAQFLLREVAGAARRLMREIHELASVYGWSERAITAMSPVRRAAYLEMLSV